MGSSYHSWISDMPKIHQEKESFLFSALPRIFFSISTLVFLISLSPHCQILLHSVNSCCCSGDFQSRSDAFLCLQSCRMAIHWKTADVVTSEMAALALERHHSHFSLLHTHNEGCVYTMYNNIKDMPCFLLLSSAVTVWWRQAFHAPPLGSGLPPSPNSISEAAEGFWGFAACGRTRLPTHTLCKEPANMAEAGYLRPAHSKKPY